MSNSEFSTATGDSTSVNTKGHSPQAGKSKRSRAKGRARVHKPKEPRRTAQAATKQDLVIAMLKRTSGVSVDDIIAKTGWQPHSVRGFLSGLVKKKLKLPLVSDVGKDGMRRYHIAAVNPSKA